MQASRINGTASVPNASYAVQMLMSLLFVYPGIGSARLKQQQSVLALEFYSRCLLTDAQLHSFAEEVRQAYAIWEMVHADSGHLIRIYRASGKKEAIDGKAGGDSSELFTDDTGETSDNPNRMLCDVDSTVLERMRPRNFREYWNGLTEALECVAVELSVPLLTREEIEALVTLVAESWGSRLVIGTNLGSDVERIMLESDSLNACLEALKLEFLYNRPAEATADLIAYRDEVRIVVNAGEA